MELPSFLLNKTMRERFLHAIEIMPNVASQMAEYEGIRVRPILLTVYGYTPNGLVIFIDHFWKGRTCWLNLPKLKPKGATSISRAIRLLYEEICLMRNILMFLSMSCIREEELMLCSA